MRSELIDNKRNKPCLRRHFLAYLGIVIAASLMVTACHDPEKTELSLRENDAPIISDAISTLDLTTPGPYSQTVIDYSLYPAENRIIHGIEIPVVQGVYDPKVLDATVETDAALEGMPIKTDVRGVIHIPVPPDGAKNSGPYPLVVILHGNSDTCRKASILPDGTVYYGNKGIRFTNYGHCFGPISPSPVPILAEEMPSYKGYEQVAEYLASNGYIVASINANLGITGQIDTPAEDPSLILARGRLVLRHLAFFRGLHDGSEASHGGIGDLLKGKVDFRYVGLMGHSRGGEGVRAAEYLYQTQDPDSYASDLLDITIDRNPSTDIDDLTVDMTIQGIFEIAPTDRYIPDPATDGRTRLALDALGAHRAVMLGTCDSDIEKLLGIVPFTERRFLDNQSHTFSSVFTVPGAIHNYFNSIWLKESPKNYVCTSATKHSLGEDMQWVQQELVRLTASSFFMGFVGNLPDRRDYQKVHDPQFYLPAEFEAVTNVSLVRESMWHHNTVVKKAKEYGNEPLGFDEQVFNVDSNGIRRELISLDPSRLSIDHLDLQLFESPYSLENTWILSLSLAHYDDFDPTTASLADLGIRLIFDDGTVSAPVSASDYAELDNHANEFIGCYNTEHEVDGGMCELVAENYPKAACYDDKYPWDYTEFIPNMDNDKRGTCIHRYPLQKKYLVFSEIPIEIDDFGISDGCTDEKGANRSIMGVRLDLDALGEGRIFVDKTMMLREKTMLGDVNEDGVVDSSDVQLIAAYSVKFEIPPSANLDLGDVNFDGVVDIVDALIVAQYIEGMCDSFPCRRG